MERILIIGCSGSGKSTLARAMGEKLGLPVIHLDQLWWKPGWENYTKEEFDEKLSAVLQESRWIMDGNFRRTMPQRLEKSDTVIYLDFSRWACLRGVAHRILTNYGKVRPDMSAGCPERFDWEFIKWIWSFNRENRQLNYDMLARARHVKTIVLKNRREVKRFLESL